MNLTATELTLDRVATADWSSHYIDAEGTINKRNSLCVIIKKLGLTQFQIVRSALNYFTHSNLASTAQKLSGLMSQLQKDSESTLNLDAKRALCEKAITNFNALIGRHNEKAEGARKLPESSTLLNLQTIWDARAVTPKRKKQDYEQITAPKASLKPARKPSRFDAPSHGTRRSSRLNKPTPDEISIRVTKH